MLEWIELAMRDIHAYLLTLIPSMNDRVGISVSSDYFAHGSAGLSFRPANALTVNDLWDLVEGLVQSNATFRIDESFSISLIIVEMPVGAAPTRSLSVNAITQRSIISIENRDNLCLPRALVVGEANIALKASAITRVQ